MKNLLTLLFSLSVVLVISHRPNHAQESEAKATAEHAKTIDTLRKKYQEYDQLNAAVLVAENGKVIVREGYGTANMEWDIPIEPNTKFRIGSVTKQFTAALILLLVEDGKIKLDSPITEYLTDYRKDTGSKVTVHQLLNHTSGIPSYTTPDFFENHSREPFEVDEFVSKFASGDLEFEPGTEFRYNNSGYYLLGAIIEKVTGETYASVLQTRIFDPLEMSDTGFDTHAKIIKRRAQGYVKTSAGYENAAYLDMGSPYAAGSLYSTIDDLFKWDQALYGHEILSEKSKELMFKPGLGEYGYGVVILERTIGDKKIRVIQHGGGINGFECLFFRCIDQKHLCIILDNIGLGRLHEKITKNVISILEDQPFDLPKKSIGDAISNIAFENGGTAAVKKYRELKESSPNEYSFDDEESLNELGYKLLSQDKISDAIEIFKLNVETFPEAFNPYDSLGEAYLIAGDEKLGLENYKKSIELNPENLGAIQIIKRLEGKELVVGPDILEAYIGKYQAGGMTLTMRVEGGELIGQPVGQAPATLEPVSETEFVITKLKAQIEFKKDEDGKVIGMLLTQGTQTLEAKKIE